MLTIKIIPVLKDNYIYLIHDPISKQTAAVDPAEAQPVLDVLAENSWQLTYVLNTHHHWDHTNGNMALKQKTGCQIIAPCLEQNIIPGVDHAVNADDTVALGAHTATVIYIPGHTLGHVAYYFAENALLFCGDTVFVMGCGRMFEGTAEQMWHSLDTLRQLPADTAMYCTHEYSLANAWFALRIEPDNIDIQQRLQTIKQLRKNQQPTVPSTIALECATNPFLRVDHARVQKYLGMEHAAPAQVFAELRRRKDLF